MFSYVVCKMVFRQIKRKTLKGIVTWRCLLHGRFLIALEPSDITNSCDKMDSFNNNVQK